MQRKLLELQRFTRCPGIARMRSSGLLTSLELGRLSCQLHHAHMVF
jgi:hypothetical protein